MEVRDQMTLETLQGLEKKESNASQAKCLRIITLAIQGFTALAIALTLGMSRRAVQKRVERFNREGLQGLSEGRGGFRWANTQITDNGLKYLKGLTELGSLDLDDCQATDEGVTRLQQGLPRGELFYKSREERRGW